MNREGRAPFARRLCLYVRCPRRVFGPAPKRTDNHQVGVLRLTRLFCGASLRRTAEGGCPHVVSGTNMGLGALAVARTDPPGRPANNWRRGFLLGRGMLKIALLVMGNREWQGRG